jgi:hypothetical protein
MKICSLYVTFSTFLFVNDLYISFITSLIGLLANLISLVAQISGKNDGKNGKYDTNERSKTIKSGELAGIFDHRSIYLLIMCVVYCSEQASLLRVPKFGNLLS